MRSPGWQRRRRFFNFWTSIQLCPAQKQGVLAFVAALCLQCGPGCVRGRRPAPRMAPTWGRASPGRPHGETPSSYVAVGSGRTASPSRRGPWWGGKTTNLDWSDTKILSPGFHHEAQLNRVIWMKTSKRGVSSSGPSRWSVWKKDADFKYLSNFLGVINWRKSLIQSGIWPPLNKPSKGGEGPLPREPLSSFHSGGINTVQRVRVCAPTFLTH